MGCAPCWESGASASAQQLNPQQIQIIENTAASICNTVKEAKGQKKDVQIEGDIKAQLNGLVGKIADLGGSAKGALTREEFEGLSRDATATALESDRGCRERVFNKMFDKLGSFESDQGNIAISVVLNRDPAIEKRLLGLQSVPESSTRPEQAIAYDLKREPGSSKIVYHLPYLDLVRQGGPVNGLLYDRVPFEGELPALLVTVQNTTKHVLTLTRAVLNIQSSKIISEPIPVFDDLSQGCLKITNQGWADIVEPVLSIDISRDSGDIALFAPERHSLSLQTISDTTCIPLREYIPPALRRDRQVKVSGTLDYGATGDRHSLAFSTRVKLDLRAGQGVPPDAIYNAFFKAGEPKPVPIDLQPVQEVDPEKVAAFLLRIKTDRTSQTAMTIDFGTIEGGIIRGGDLTLDLFVPRIETRNWRMSGIKAK